MLLGLNLAESIHLDFATSGWSLETGLICDLIPLPRLSRLYHRIGAELAEKFRDRFASANAGFLMGTHQYWATGEWATAIATLLRGCADFRALGRVRDWAATMHVASDALFDCGLDVALERARRSSPTP